MRQVIETYALIWFLMIMFLLGTAFTQINMHTSQARKIYNDIRSEVQASNGSIVDTTDRLYKSTSDNGYSLTSNGFEYEYSPSNAIEAEERLKETKSEIYDACLEEMGKVSKKTPEKNKQKCSCVSDTIIEKLITIMIEDPEADIESVGPKIIQDIESKCGQLPKGMKI